MPNWCFQYAQVDGELADIEEFVNAIRVRPTSLDTDDPNDEWNLNQLHPTPIGLLNAVKGSGSDAESEENTALMKSNTDEFGYPTWYEWRHENWGTKWGACHIQLDASDLIGLRDLLGKRKSLMFSWESAWTPAIQLVQNISKQFPKLIFGFYYTEEANFFSGYCVCHNGEIIKDYETPQEIMENRSETDDSEWFQDLVTGLDNGMDQTMQEYAKKLQDGSASVK